MRVFITGVGGFLGSALARYFYEGGWSVCGSSHSERGFAGLGEILEIQVVQGLADRVDPGIFSTCDAVVHCAYDSRAGAMENNVTGTEAFRKAACDAGVPYQLFVSSHSARPDAAAEYGQLKWRQEGPFLEAGLGVVRPGLIIGSGGLFARVHASLKRSPVLVLPGAKKVPVYYIALSDLLLAMKGIIQDRIAGAINLFAASPVSLRAFSLAALAVSGRRPPVLSVPLGPLFAVSTLMHRVLRSLPASLARLETLRQNMLEPIHVSDLRDHVPTPLTLIEAMQAIS